MSGYIQRLFDRAAISVPSPGGYSSSPNLSSQPTLQSIIRSGSPLADHDQRLLDPHYQSGLASPLGSEGILGEEMTAGFEHAGTEIHMVMPPMTNRGINETDDRPPPSDIQNPPTARSKASRRNPPDHAAAEKSSRDKQAAKTDLPATPVVQQTTETVTKIIRQDQKPESLPEANNANSETPDAIPDPLPEINTRIIKTVTHPDWQPPPDDNHAEATPVPITRPEPDTQPELQNQPLFEDQHIPKERDPVSRPETGESKPVLARVPQPPQPDPVPDPAPQAPQAPVKIIEKIVETNKNPQPQRNRHSGPLTAHSVSKIGHLPQRKRSFSLFGMRRR